MCQDILQRFAPVMTAVLAGLVGACGPDASVDRRTVPMDTIDGTIVARNGENGLWKQGQSWVIEERFRLGGVDGSPSEMFGGPKIGLSFGPEGRLFVLEGQAEEIRVFDHAGEFQYVIGGPGQGPGEFDSPVAMGWDGRDRLWIANAFDGRYTVFDAQGELVRVISNTGRRGVDRLAFELHFLDGGAFIDRVATFAGVRPIRRDTTGAVLDSFPQIDYPFVPESPIWMSGLTDETRQALIHLLPEPVWTHGLDSTLWIGRTDELKLVQRTLRGDTLRIIETVHRRRDFSASEQLLVDHARRELDVEVPFAPPVMQNIHVLDDGHILVQIAEEMNAPGRVTDVFDPEGRFLGSMEWPVAVDPRAQSALRGDTIVALALGNLDVPLIVRMTIGRSEGVMD